MSVNTYTERATVSEPCMFDIEHCMIFIWGFLQGTQCAGITKPGRPIKARLPQLHDPRSSQVAGLSAYSQQVHRQIPVYDSHTWSWPHKPSQTCLALTQTHTAPSLFPSGQPGYSHNPPFQSLPFSAFGDSPKNPIITSM